MSSHAATDKLNLNNPVDTAVEATSNPASDNEGGEKPVREKLKKTSIDTNGQATPSDITSHPTTTTTTDEAPVPLTRKRSHEDVEDQENDLANDDKSSSSSSSRHVRKRSRDGQSASPSALPSPDSAVNTSAKRTPTPTLVDAPSPNHLTSPKGKRNRDQFQRDENIDSKSSKVQDVADSSATEPSTAATSEATDERGAKRPRDGETKPITEPKPTTLPATSGFANISTNSPFAALSSTKPAASDPATTTSQSAFEKSSFSKLAQSTSSPFSALGSSSPFGALGSTKPPPPIEGLSKTESVFSSTNNTNTASPFASAKPSLGSAFGSLSNSASPFASALSGNSAFGSTTTPGSKPPILGLSSKPSKPFGAPAAETSDNEEDVNSDEESDAPNKDRELGAQESDSARDKRFVEQDVETGEENEETVASARAKLYVFETGEWKERGTGTFKLNVTAPGGEDDADQSTPKARFLMRAEGSHRLIVNTAFGKQTRIGDAKGDKPSSGALLFHGILDGYDKPALLQARMKAANAQDLWQKAQDVRERL